MTHRLAPPKRPRAADLARSLLSLIVLVALTIGLPLVLVVVAPVQLPHDWPSVSELWSALLRPDDGRLFLGVLKLAGWAAWAWFAISVLVQLVSDLRGLPAPHLPTMGAAQRSAAALLTSATLLFTLAGPGIESPAPVLVSAPLRVVATPTVALDQAGTARDMGGAAWRKGGSSPTTFIVPASASLASSHLSTATRYLGDATDAADPRPRLIVHGGDTLWGLAERHLGRGERFVEIDALNHGKPQPDGRALTDAGAIYPGWVLLMPTDAHSLPALPPSPSPSGDDGWRDVHQVAAGETLWSIAQDNLGDGERYPEIFDLNAGAPQLDGGALTDPDLIRPGWLLTLPPAPTSAPTAAPEGPATEPHVAVPFVPTIPAVPAPVPTFDAAPPLPDPSPELERAVPGVDERDHKDAPATAGDSDAPVTVSMFGSELFVGLTALAAAGFIGEIARRRRRQQRLRRTGQGIAMPDPSSAEAYVELRLRHAPQPFTIAVLKQSLHRLGPLCSAAGRDLPRVGVILVAEDSVTLMLTADDPDAVGPFVATTERRWTASADALAGEDPVEDLGLYPEPYPALVCVGISDSAVVLVNLEAAGLLALNGPDEIAQGALRGIAAELTTSAMTGGASVLLDPQFADLAYAADSMRVHAAPTRATLMASVERTASDCREVIDGAGATDALHARSMLTGDDVWNPVILVSIHEAAAAQPWAGYAVVTTNQSESPWRFDLTSDTTATLEPFGITVRPQLVTQDDLLTFIGLLRIGSTEPGPINEPETFDAATEIADALAGLQTGSGRPDDVEVDVPGTELLLDDDDGDSDSPSELQSTAPGVLVLGPVEILRTTGNVARNRVRRQTELVAFLALHPRATYQGIDEVIGGGRRVDPAYRNSFVSRTRGWLGGDLDGTPYLPIVRGNSYQLSSLVTCDWFDFLRLAERGLSQGKHGAKDLRRALRMVRGRPFADARPGTYGWADPLLQEMTTRITDVARALAAIELENGDYRAVAAATAIGLLVDSCDEKLFRLAITAAHRRGDDREVARLVDSLRERSRQIDPDGDLEQETHFLLGALVERSPG
ncbi:LysM peptidoglycan-binding domain-containing protein [Pengzhenrongella sicca]|uniref:LysM peptidoglycan-binding domain-containing protein n=1 Tax=Pengzhenrongella sicca TaxID=2819238 RepID=A0A8A4ZKD2_9MICO|nr:LysM peptidoglycan-binding domain-containing protein [Pengzhenrongella sicca]QTE30048.1 LysM peptidoglycan-binding domain-containing protein [Pengzhenrongella sicca]